ncbi:MAG: DUF177 domain-containing protein [Alistipes sp.]|nr:DUF177 domain-containing protein [Alistipes senegalensis]MCM1250859.1 DUF177 domain-containing protein [Alistipes sp.]
MDAAKGYSIAYKGLKNGTHDFAFKVGGSLFEAYGSAEIKDGDCDVEVALAKSETQLVADVAIRGSVVVACDRCLEDCRIPVDFSGRLVVKFSDEVREYDGEVLWLLPGEDEVDLAQYIYESIVLSLPYQRVHSEGGCDPEMLRRFRIVSGEEFAEIESRSGERRQGGAWEKLAQLRERMSETDEGAPTDDEKK